MYAWATKRVLDKENASLTKQNAHAIKKHVITVDDKTAKLAILFEIAILAE